MGGGALISLCARDTFFCRPNKGGGWGMDRSWGHVHVYSLNNTRGGLFGVACGVLRFWKANVDPGATYGAGDFDFVCSDARRTSRGPFFAPVSLVRGGAHYRGGCSLVGRGSGRDNIRGGGGGYDRERRARSRSSWRRHDDGEMSIKEEANEGPRLTT